MRLFILSILIAVAAQAADKPNILWITCEDTSPHFGCYDDRNANTPNVDALAKRGLKFRQVWSNAPVCAPARTCIISGRWAPSDGAEHMRSEVPMPAGHKMFPQLLREAGYYCSNNAKEDYNLVKPEGVWDESSAKAHWKNRKPGQPFFSVFNLVTTHESQIRAKPHTLVHDPEKMEVPYYMPDTPVARHDWAQHYDNVTTMDGQVAEILKQLASDGLAEDTIVFFFSDHGTGMPRSKRWPMNSGLQVPFITYFPDKCKELAPAGYRADSHTDQLIGFIDLAPTMLALAGLKPPSYMQGTAFAGKDRPAPRAYNYGFRGRMDERIDLTRSITDGRFVYIHQFMPHLPYGQHIGYMFEMPTTQVWHEIFTQGKLDAIQSAFWKPKPTDELYDLQKDPYEIINLARTSDHVATVIQMRRELMNWMESTRDLGLIPEGVRLADAAGRSPADVYAGDAAYPVNKVLNAALLASNKEVDAMKAFELLMKEENSAMRYWGVMSLIIRGEEMEKKAHDIVVPLLDDKVLSVRVAAAEVLLAVGTEQEQAKCWEVLLNAADPKNSSAAAAVEALNVIDRLGVKAAPKKDIIAKLVTASVQDSPKRYREYPQRLFEHLGTTLGFDVPKPAK